MIVRILAALLVVIVALNGCAAIIGGASGSLAAISCPMAVATDNSSSPGERTVWTFLAILGAPFIAIGGFLAGSFEGLEQDLGRRPRDARELFLPATCGMN